MSRHQTRERDSEQTNMKVIVFSLLLVGAFSAFRVKKVSPTEVRVEEGHPFKVICTTDNWYEVRRTDISI